MNMKDILRVTMDPGTRTLTQMGQALLEGAVLGRLPETVSREVISLVFQDKERVEAADKAVMALRKGYNENAFAQNWAWENVHSLTWEEKEVARIIPWGDNTTPDIVVAMTTEGIPCGYFTTREEANEALPDMECIQTWRLKLKY